MKMVEEMRAKVKLKETLYNIYIKQRRFQENIQDEFDNYHHQHGA